MIQKLLFVSSFCLSSLYLFAQNSTPDSAQMADVMRSNGKIYVVVAVILAIFIGLILYLYRLDKKISRIEREKPI